MNVTEEVTIHRPNVSTLLSSAFIRGRRIKSANKCSIKLSLILKFLVETAMILFSVFRYFLRKILTVKCHEEEFLLFCCLFIRGLEFCLGHVTQVGFLTGKERANFDKKVRLRRLYCFVSTFNFTTALTLISRLSLDIIFQRKFVWPKSPRVILESLFPPQPSGCNISVTVTR